MFSVNAAFPSGIYVNLKLNHIESNYPAETTLLAMYI